MANLENLEGNVGQKSTKKASIGKLTAGLMVLGVGLIAFGIYLSSSGVSIRADVEPPKPADPSRVSPPTPDDPGDYPPVPPGPNEFAFRAGWSMISGEELYGYDLTEFRNAGLALYSFNDPKYANRDWAIVYGNSTECQAETIGCDVIYPQPPLGYYVYNKESKEVRVTLQPSEAPNLSNNIYGRGWHVIYWGGDAISEQELLDRITLTYSDGKKLTAKQAVSDKEHKVSLKIYGVVDEHTIDISKAIKELGSNQNQITTIPKEGYFWLYFRRTAKRVTAISLNDDYSVVENEKTLIDAWIKSGNLTECGDPAGTVYTGGSCLYDESLPGYRDKYELIIEKFPNKPWRN